MVLLSPFSSSIQSSSSSYSSPPLRPRILHSSAHLTPIKKAQKLLLKNIGYETISLSSRAFVLDPEEHKMSKALKSPSTTKIKLQTVKGSSWKVFYSTGLLIRRIEFENLANPNIVIAISGYRDGRINIELTKLALRQLNYRSFTQEEPPISTAKFYQIIDNCYEFPSYMRSIVQTLIEKGNWKTVTPLSKEEEKHLVRTKVHYKVQNETR